MQIAVLLTCHNRRDKTLACLRALYACGLPSHCGLVVYIVDDGSQDGTGEAVQTEFPAVQLLRGDGSLFWNGGMRLAFGQALARGYDAFLWLNDDTMLYADALHKLLACADTQAQQNGGKGAIIVGATREAESGCLTYGGLVSRSRWSPHYYVRLPVSDAVQACMTLNGNCVLIPATVATIVGNLDAVFVHAIGDWDYGFRARRAGFDIWMAPGFVGTCSLNPPVPVTPQEAANISAQLRRVCSPKRIPPAAWRTFVRRHYGMFWPVYFIQPYLSVMLRATVLKLKGL